MYSVSPWPLGHTRPGLTEAVFGGRCVVGAGVATLGVGRGLVHVGGGDGADKIRQGRVDIVGDEGRLVCWRRPG